MSQQQSQPAKRKRESSPEQEIKKDQHEDSARSEKLNHKESAEESPSASPERLLKKGKKEQKPKRSGLVAKDEQPPPSPPKQPTEFMQGLPDVLFNIFSYLSATDVLRAAPTAKAFLSYGQKLPATAGRKARDVEISLQAGSKAQLIALIRKMNLGNGFTPLQTLLLMPNQQKTLIQKQLHAKTLAEILAGKISLQQVLEQINQLESFAEASEKLSLAKAWSYKLPHWQKAVLTEGVDWLSLIYYPHNLRGNNVFSQEDMSSAWYTLVHVEVINWYDGEYNDAFFRYVDRLNGSSVDEFIEVIVASGRAIEVFINALANNRYATAQALLTKKPALVEQMLATHAARLRTALSLAVTNDAISTIRLLLSKLTVDQYLSLISGQGQDEQTPLYKAVFRGDTRLVRLLLLKLNPEQRQVMILAPQPVEGCSILYSAIRHKDILGTLFRMLSVEQRQQAILTPQRAGSFQGLNLLYAAVQHGNEQTVSEFLDMLTVEQRQAAILVPQGAGQDYGESALYAAFVTPSYYSGVAPSYRNDMAIILLEALSIEHRRAAILTLQSATVGRLRGQSALFTVVSANNVEMAERLLADLTSAQQLQVILAAQTGSFAGHSPLFIAASRGHTKMVFLLLYGLTVQQWQEAILAEQGHGSTNQGQSALSIAVQERHITTISTLLARLDFAQRRQAIMAQQGEGYYRGLNIVSRAVRSPGWSPEALFSELPSEYWPEIIMAPQGEGRYQGQSTLYIAASNGNKEAVFQFLNKLNPTQQQKAILALRGTEISQGGRVFSPAIVALLKRYLSAPKLAEEMPLTASSSSSNPSQFFSTSARGASSLPSASADSVPTGLSPSNGKET